MATSTDLRAAIEEVQSQLPAEQLEAAVPEALAAQTLYGGRVYSTAAGALSLEIYYRYLSMYTK